MPNIEFCTCDYCDCAYHFKKHNNECTACIEKNLKRHEIPACFWNKIGETANVESEYSFNEFARKVIDRE